MKRKWLDLRGAWRPVKPGTSKRGHNGEPDEPGTKKGNPGPCGLGVALEGLTGHLNGVPGKGEALRGKPNQRRKSNGNFR